MHGRGRASKVVDLIHLQQNGLHHIVADQLESWVSKMMNNILLPPCEEVVDHDHIVPPCYQLVHEVAPHKPGPTSDHDPLPPLPDLCRNPRHRAVARLGDPGKGVGRRRVGEVGSEREGSAGTGVVGAEAGEGRLDDEEAGANEDPDEDEEKALLAEHVMEGPRERSRVLESFGRVGRRRLEAARHLLVPAPVVHARLLVQLLHHHAQPQTNPHSLFNGL